MAVLPDRVTILLTTKKAYGIVSWCLLDLQHDTWCSLLCEWLLPRLAAKGDGSVAVEVAGVFL